MRINPNSVALNRPTTKSEIGVSKEIFLGTPKAPKSNSITDSAIVSREDLMSLASDLKQGRINKDEANNRFVGMVVNNSLTQSLSERDRDKIIKDISEFFSQDEDFLRHLEKNLTNLTT